MKINIEAEGMKRIPHSEKMGACYNFSSGVVGEIHEPTAEELGKTNVKIADKKLQRLIPEGGIIWTAPGK